ncbi:hypothetical protein ABPG74_004476 [Tetrahymena malaccensis]
MNKTSSLILLFVALNIATAQIITIPIEKRVPESESNGFLDDTDQAAVDRLVNHNQYMYSGNIEVGTSKQTYTVDFDTGSNLLWLTGKNCPTCVKDGYKHSYDCQPSDGCNMTTTPASITYGDGSGVSGHIAKVPISIAGLAPVTEALLVVEKSVRNGGLESDGLMGLGVYDEHNTNAVPFVNQLYKQGIISKSQFSFYLGFGQNESELIIGGVDNSKLANPSQLYFHPIIINGQHNDSQRWSVAIKSVSFGDQSVPLASKNVAIVDSGTSLLVMRNDVFKQWINYLKTVATLKTITSGGSVFYGVKCGATLPDLTFTLTDVNGVDRSYSLPSSFYVIQDNSSCIIGVQGIALTSDVQFILGDVFMRRFVSVFDYSTVSMGLAQSVANPATANNTHKINTLPAFLALGLVIIAVSALIFLALRRK